MPGLTAQWPAWKEYVLTKTLEEELEKDKDYINTKKEIIEEFGEESLHKSWLKTCAALETVTEELESEGSNILPILNIKDVLNDTVPELTKDNIRRVGAFVVRQVIPRSETETIFANLKEYVSNPNNTSKITGWPEATPSILRLYNAPAQNAARSHPNQLSLIRWINNLWTWTPDEDVSAEPLMYADAVRIRPPKESFLGLGPHIDAGSLCRWADKNYRQTYSRIFSGEPEKHDCFDLDARKDADQMRFPGRGQSTVLRAFQGWTALSRTGPREGTIRLFPALKWQIAYVLLRPFFRPPKDQSEIMNPEAWSFDAESAWFPGTTKETSQHLSSTSHPHLKLKSCLIYAPAMEAGDTVWWHTDMCHAVDAEHIGSKDASVVYIAATPTTRINKEYMRRQYQKMDKGLPPPDFERRGEGDESLLEGYEGFSANPQLWKELMASN